MNKDPLSPVGVSNIKLSKIGHSLILEGPFLDPSIQRFDVLHHPQLEFTTQKLMFVEYRRHAFTVTVFVTLTWYCLFFNAFNFNFIFLFFA